jgi:hypothetical protein
MEEKETKDKVEQRVLPIRADRPADSSPKFLPSMVTVVLEVVLAKFGATAVMIGISYENTLSLFDD